MTDPLFDYPRDEAARLSSHGNHMAIHGDTTHCLSCGKMWDTNDVSPPWCTHGVTPIKSLADTNNAVNVLLFILILSAIVLLIISLAHTAKATEYSMIDDSDKRHCAEYAERESMRFNDRMPAMVQAYADCVSILPTRLELPPLAGSVPASADPTPASGETWAEACDREYRTWDADTGTVIRRGSPDRVKCPLVLRSGEWVTP